MHYDLSDQYVHSKSVVHQRDPRVKVVTTLFYIFAVGITPEGKWWAFGLQFVVLLAIVISARIDPLYTVKRSFIAAPFILAAIAVPFTTPGQEMFTVPGLEWTVSELGLIRFASILLRAWLAIQCAIVLGVTTRVPDTFWALGTLRFPATLVSTIAFMYRYLFVLADEALRMLRARAARSPRITGAPRPSVIWQGRIAGSMVGSLFLRSLERSERVYAAMLARGYDGKMRTMASFRMTSIDWAYLLLVGSGLCLIQIFANVG